MTRVSLVKYPRVLVDMLERHEGRKLVAYPDSEGIATVGVGHNLQADSALEILQRVVNIGDAITEDESDLLLNKDIANAIAMLQKIDWYNTQCNERQYALIDLMFNLGPKKFAEFKRFAIAMKLAKYENAALELLSSKYAKQVGYRAVEIAGIIRTGKLC